LQKAFDDIQKGVQQRECNLEHCDFKAEIRQAILESKTPEVILWNVDKTQILENENIMFSWEVLYAKKVTISGFGEVPLKDNRTISPRRNTTYILTIQDYKDNIYEVEHPINITVIPLPIVEIREEKLKIERGNTAMLHWKASNVCKIILSFDRQIIDISDSTEFSVQPHENTIYKLIATALDNKTIIEKEINIEVFPKPEIKLFEVSPEVVIASIPVTISWRVQNAKKIEINNGVGEVREEGQKTILQDKNTLYQLTAWGELSSVTKEIVVKVFPTPIIKSLLVPVPYFKDSLILNINMDMPKIDITVNMPEFNLNLPELNFATPKFIEPSDDFLKLSETNNKAKISVFNFSKIYEYVRKRVRG
jgi:hypothetical protein